MIEKLKEIMDKMYGKRILFFLPLILVCIFIAISIVIFFLGSNSGGGIMLSGSSPRSYNELSFDNNYSPSTGKGYPPTEGYVSAPSVDRKIVKNASVDILVKKVEDTAKNIQNVAEKYNGLVDNSNISNKGIDTKYGNLTIRIPNENFYSAIEDIKKLAVKVNSEAISSDDVTAQHVDMEARLKSKKAVELQYVILLQKTTTVAEIVSVQSYLNTTREEIEVLQAQINYLSGQVAMSSIAISMTSESEVQIFGITWRPITVIKQSFRNLLVDLASIVDWMISFVFALPGLLIKFGLFVGIFWIVIKITKRFYKIYKKDKTSIGQNY